MESGDRAILEKAVRELGWRPVGVVPLAGDASARRFFRITDVNGRNVVACLYPRELAARAAADFDIQRWGWERALPIPEPLARAGRVTISEDLGEEDLERSLAGQGEAILERALLALAAFQRCAWQQAPTPCFDAAFFRRELAGFEKWALAPAMRGSGAISDFLDTLAEALARHPYRLLHRDFHANNLFLLEDRVVAVDFQDMRGGPDTYDLVSLLRERAGASVVVNETRWCEEAAATLGWEPGWQRRYLECAAQRGLKVVGTFLRLGGTGRSAYLAMLPGVRNRAQEALVALGAPEELRRALGRAGGL